MLPRSATSPTDMIDVGRPGRDLEFAQHVDSITGRQTNSAGILMRRLLNPSRARVHLSRDAPRSTASWRSRLLHATIVMWWQQHLRHRRVWLAGGADFCTDAVSFSFREGSYHQESLILCSQASHTLRCPGMYSAGLTQSLSLPSLSSVILPATACDSFPVAFALVVLAFAEHRKIHRNVFWNGDISFCDRSRRASS